MRTIPLPATCRRLAAATWFLLLLAAMLNPALAQSRLERSGVTLYWGLVPAAVVADKHALAELHGGPPKQLVDAFAGALRAVTPKLTDEQLAELAAIRSRGVDTWNQSGRSVTT